jgi:hypothetical protein
MSSDFRVHRLPPRDACQITILPTEYSRVPKQTVGSFNRSFVPALIFIKVGSVNA